MKNLFDENEKFNRDALNLLDEVRAALQPIFDARIAEGYKAREVEAVMHSQVAELTFLQLILKKKCSQL